MARGMPGTTTQRPRTQTCRALLAWVALALCAALAPQARAQPAAPVVVSASTLQINVDAGGGAFLQFDPSVAFRFRELRRVEVRLCKDIQSALGVVNSSRDPCTGQPALMLFADASPLSIFTSVDPASLTSMASSSSLRPRSTHLVLSERFSAPNTYFVLRINLNEAPRGPELTEARLHFLAQGGQQTQGFFQLGQALPPLQAQIRFKGSGLLRARWEVVQPGDPEPSELDLTPEPYLSLEQRARQHHWRLLQRVQVYLSATGVTLVPGPNPARLPNDRYGRYMVLLRIEPSQALDGASGTSPPLVMPVLTYYIGASAAPAMCGASSPQPLRVLAPQGLVFSDRPLVFSWEGRADVAMYRVELQSRGRTVYAARVRGDSSDGITRFAVPAFAQAQLGGDALRWRVAALSDTACSAGASRWVDIQWGRVLASAGAGTGPAADTAGAAGDAAAAASGATSALPGTGPAASPGPPGASAAATPAAQAEPAHEPGQLLVLWPNADQAPAGLALLASRHRQQPVRVLALPTLALVIAQFQLADTVAALALRDTLRAEQPDWVVDLNARSVLQQTAAPGAAAAPRLFALQQLRLPAPAMATAATGAGIRIGVVDAALDPALALNLGSLKTRSLLVPSEVPAVTEHGNEIAQLIAGQPLGNGFSGVTAGAQLLWASTMRQQGRQASSHSLHTAAALDWLLGEGAQVINLSLGGVGDAVLQKVFERAAATPALLVAAAGNGGPTAAPVFPAAYPGVVAVTAIDADLRPWARAQRGAYIGLAAPGVDLWIPQRADASGAAAAAPPGTAGRYSSGSSYASALATAALARAGPGFWGLTKAQQLESLCRGALDLGEAGRDRVFGCGLLQVSAVAP
jgi:hypothetical protein